MTSRISFSGSTRLEISCSTSFSSFVRYSYTLPLRRTYTWRSSSSSAPWILWLSSEVFSLNEPYKSTRRLAGVARKSSMYLTSRSALRRRTAHLSSSWSSAVVMSA